MKGTKGYQGVMETMYISTLERSMEMKRSESGPTALTVQMEPACLSQALTAQTPRGSFGWKKEQCRLLQVVVVDCNDNC